MLEHEELFSCGPLPPGRIIFFPWYIFPHCTTRTWEAILKILDLFRKTSSFDILRVYSCETEWVTSAGVKRKWRLSWIIIFFFCSQVATHLSEWTALEEETAASGRGSVEFICLCNDGALCGNSSKRKDPSQIDRVCRRKSQSFTPHRVALTWRKSI